MKKIYGLLGGALLLLTLMVSCQKQDDAVPTPTPQEVVAPVELDLSGSFDELKAMAFDATDVADQIQLSPAGDWQTHCFLRKEGDNTFVGVATIDFNATLGSDNKIYLKIKNKSVSVRGIPTGKTPKKGETWYIMGIAGGGELIGGTKVSFAYKAALDQNLPANKIRVPLASSWTKVKVLDNDWLEGKLSFKPQGVLLRVRILNRLSSAVNPESFSLTSSVASREGYFDMSPGSSVSEGATPKWTFAEQPSTLDPYYAEIPVNQTLASSPSPRNEFAAYRLVWVMRDPMATGGETKVSSLKFKLNRYGDALPPATGVERPPFSVKLKTDRMTNGKTHRINVELLRYKTPTEYVAPRNVGLVARTFAIDNSVSTSGYYALPISNIENVIPRGYHLPNQNEWQALFSPTFQHIKLDDSPSINETPQTMDENVELNREKNTFSSSYVSKRIGRKIVTYAVRFMPTTREIAGFPAYSKKDKIAVFKYEILDDAQMSATDRVNNHGIGKQLRVTSRFIGQDININTVANESFWQTASSEQVSVVFPLCGYVDMNTPPSIQPNDASFGTKRTKEQMRAIATAWEILPQGYYWSVSQTDGPYIQRMDTKHTNPYTIAQNARDLYVIRPFTGSLD